MTDGLTFAALLTAAGAGTAAAVVTSLISLVKTAFANTPVGSWDGAVMAFVSTAVLYVLAGVSVGVATLDAGLGLFIAWLTCATAAVGVHKLIVKPVVERVRQIGS